MSSSEYDELLNDLYAKVEAGEITEEEACKKMWMAPDIRIPHDIPDDYILPSNNT